MEPQYKDFLVDMPDEELLRNLRRAKGNVFGSKAPISTLQRTDPNADRAREQIKGFGEGITSVVSGMAAAPVAGYGGLAKLAATGDPVAATRAITNTGEAMTYEPRTDAGRTVARTLNLPMEVYGKATEGMGEVGEEEYGIPKELTAGFLQAVPIALGGLKTLSPKSYKAGMNKLAQASVAPMQEMIGYHGSPLSKAGLIEKSGVLKPYGTEGIEKTSGGLATGLSPLLINEFIAGDEKKRNKMADYYKKLQPYL